MKGLCIVHRFNSQWHSCWRGFDQGKRSTLNISYAMQLSDEWLYPTWLYIRHTEQILSTSFQQAIERDIAYNDKEDTSSLPKKYHSTIDSTLRLFQ